MPIEILTSTQRAEWERFPEEIDEAALTAFFSFADDASHCVAAAEGGASAIRSASDRCAPTLPGAHGDGYFLQRSVAPLNRGRNRGPTDTDGEQLR